MEVYDILSQEYPDFFLTAATDDLNSLLKPDQDDQDGWQRLFRKLAEFLKRYEYLAWELCSLRQNIAKGSIILPSNAPMPAEEVLQLFPSTFKFHQGVPFRECTDVLVICVAPVGSDFYLDAFVRWKTDASIAKLHAIKRLGDSITIPAPKHVAFKLLTTCGTKLLGYVATTVPPQFVVTHLRRFDKAVRNIFFNSLLGPHSPDEKVSEVRLSRAHLRATLPVSQGGLGLLKSSISAAALWWTNFRCLQADPSNLPFLAGIQCFAP